MLRALTPLVLFGVVLGVSLSVRSSNPIRTDPYVVAVQGDFDGARQTLDGLSDRLRFIPSTDATVDSVHAADLGIEVPDRLDQRLAAHEVVDMVVYESATTTALPIGERAFSPRRPGRHPRARRSSRPRRPAGRRTTSPSTWSIWSRASPPPGCRAPAWSPPSCCCKTTMIVGATATRLLSRGDHGLLAAELLLPMRRWHVALAKALADLQLGVLVAGPVVVFAVGFAVLTAGSSRGPLWGPPPRAWRWW